MTPAGERRDVEIVVSVAEDHLDRLPELLARLEDAGVRVSAVHEAIGVVAGSIGPGALGRVRTLEGVAAVEESRRVALPPPESEVQ